MWLQQESKTRVFVQCVTFITGTLSMLALTAALLMVLHSANKVIKQVPGQIDATRTALTSEIDATRKDLDSQLDATRAQVLATVNTQATGLRADTKSELDAYRTVADARLGDTLARVDTALGTVDTLETALDPTLKNVAEITAHTNDATAILFRRDALPAQILGVTGAAKVALGQTALTMRTIQTATPEITENIKVASAESAKASANTAKVMANFAEATKPLPKWMRVALSVAPPLANAAAGVATMMSVTGIIP